MRTKFGGRKSSLCGYMREAHQGFHECEQTRVSGSESWNTLSTWRDCRLKKLLQLPTVDKALQDVLLNVEIVCGDGFHGVANGGQVLDGFTDAIVTQVIGGCFRAEQSMISNILFDEAVLVVATDDRIGELHIVDAAFKLARM